MNANSCGESYVAWAEYGSYHGREGLLSTNPLRFTDVAHRP